MRYDIKVRLAILGKSQVWLIQRLRDRHVNVNASELSKYKNGAVGGPKAELVLTMCDEIITEREKAREAQNAERERRLP